MTKNIFLILALMLLAFSANAQFSEVKESLYFNNDKFELKELEEKKLIQLWDSISSDSILRIYITGNTDNSADSLYNIELSKNRCNTVQEFLTFRNVNEAIFKVNYFGENKPIADNISEKGKQENRRVDIRILYKEKESAILKDTLIQAIDTCIGVDTTIILENGTELIFNKCEYEEMKECLKITTIRTADELINSGIGLNTTDNIPLVTCGMINICLIPECKVRKLCFDYPIKVRFPYPKECVPCERQAARVFNINGEGTWTDVGRIEKIRVIKIGSEKYYELEIKCPDCNFKNCDCKRCKDLKKKERRKVCPKVKLKLPYKYELIEANIYVDCPPTILNFTPDTFKNILRKNLAKTETKCYPEDHRIQVSAINTKGDTVRIDLRPLEEIKHRILFSHCKLSPKEKDNQKVWRLLPANRRAIYRKYKVRKRDFKND
jgi:hypothetical protein